MKPGDELPRLTYEPDPLDLFRYSAVTWNAHRIHYEKAYAHAEGHPDVLAHSHLRAALALRCVTEGLGPEWTLVRTAYRLRRPATPGHPLVYGARVRAVDGDTAELDLYEDHPSGAHGLEGTATVRRVTEGAPR